MKLLPLLLCIFLCLPPTEILAAEEFSEAVVAQRILQDAGYRMFRFKPVKVQAYQLTVRDKDKSTSNMHVPAAEWYVVTVQLDKENHLMLVRVDTSNSEMVSMKSLTSAAGNFPSTLSTAKIIENEPFLTLSGPNREVQIVITSPPNG